MPAFNEVAHIGDAIASLLAQTYKPIELIISDNASTDRTYDIILDYASRDDRIKPFRNVSNLGALRNFEFVRDLARGEYFMWAGAHDRWHPSFISKLLPVLDRDPNVVLAYPLTILINDADQELGVMSDRIDTRGLGDVDRMQKLLFELGYCNMFYGLIRREAVANIRLKTILGPDVLVLAELCLRGSIAQLQEPLFYTRVVRDEVFGSDEYSRRLWTALDPGRAERKSRLGTAAMWRELRNEHIKLILKSSRLSNMNRLRALAIILNSIS